jgi:hypothetical protein
MVWPAIRRVLTRIVVSLPSAFLAAPVFCGSREPYAGASLNGSPAIVNFGAADLLLLSGILALAAASAEVAVRMVRRSN